MPSGWRIGTEKRIDWTDELPDIRNLFGNGVLEFLLDSSGIVRSVNLTEDLRVRATPEDMLKATKALH